MATPRLRFPEFQDAPEWANKPLSDVAENLDNKRIPITESERTKGDIPYYGASGIIDYVKDYLFDEDLLCVSEDGANLVARTYPIAFPISGKTWVNNHAHVLRFDTPATQKLVEFYLNFTDLRNFITGMAQPKLNRAMLDSIPIPFPEREEQKRIANCLTSLDEVIAAQGQKVEALKTYKRGLMQQLFPREGETIPRLRFPEFRDGLEWGAKPLGDFFMHIRNGFVGTATPYYVEDGIPYLQGKNVKNSRIDSRGLVRISEAFHEKQRKSQLARNDILMVQSGHVGECAVVGKKYAGSNCHALIVMSPEEGQYSPYFVHYFYSEHGQNKIREITTGNTIKHILASDLKELIVSVPEPEEQQRLGEFLSELDGFIVTESEKLNTLKTHKKGLMQQLFPAPEVD